MHKGVIFVICLLVYPQLKEWYGDFSKHLLMERKRRKVWRKKEYIGEGEKQDDENLADLLILQIHKPTDKSCSQMPVIFPHLVHSSLSLMKLT